MQKNILIVEDCPSQLRMAASAIDYNMSYHSVSKYDGADAFGKIPAPDVVLIDLAMTGQAYLNVIRDIKISKPQWPIIAMTQYGNDELASQAIMTGASDYITKPASLDRLKFTIRNVLKMQNMSEAIARLERSETGHMCFSDIIGDSAGIKRALAQAQMLSSSDMPVWIDGERGTGKELFARAIHGSSATAGEAFVVIDCSKFTDSTTEAIIFGQKKSVDTLQLFARKVQEADHGTLYLKEITLLQPRLQHCLFNALETGMLQASDDFPPTPVNFRIIIGSVKHVGEIISNKEFAPMQKKLHGVVISLPPLRERKEDVAALAKHFIALHSASENKLISNLANEALKLLEGNQWPGNVIQLTRMIQRAVLLCNNNELDAGTLRLIQQLESINYSNNPNNPINLAPTLVDYSGRIKKLKSIEEEVIRFALVHSGGSMTRAARDLGIGRSTLYRKIGAMPVEQLHRA